MGKLYAIFAGLGVFLLGVLKFVLGQNAKLRDENDQLEADIQFKEDVDEADTEIEQTFSHRAEEAKEALSEDRIPDHLANPRK